MENAEYTKNGKSMTRYWKARDFQNHTADEFNARQEGKICETTKRKLKKQLQTTKEDIQTIIPVQYRLLTKWIK